MWERGWGGGDRGRSRYYVYFCGHVCLSCPSLLQILQDLLRFGGGGVLSSFAVASGTGVAPQLPPGLGTDLMAGDKQCLGPQEDRMA